MLVLIVVFVIFTHPDGRSVAINPDAVASVHPTAAAAGYHAGTMIDSTGSGSEDRERAE